MATKRPILLAVFGDAHANSTLGLCPEEGVRLPEGGRYLPSAAQRWLWTNWLDWWAWVEGIRSANRAQAWAVANGDLVDGTAHHGQTQYITADEEAMQYVATRALMPCRDWVRAHKGKVFVLRGTRVHVGSHEDALARWLNAEREPITDAWARYVLKLDVYGVRIDVRHHAPVGTSRTWLKGNPANTTAALIYMEHQLAGHPYPHVALRSHRHKFSMSGKNYPTECVILPAWQLATDYIHKIAPEAIADIGGIAVLVEANGTYQIFQRIYRPEPAPTYHA